MDQQGSTRVSTEAHAPLDGLTVIEIGQNVAAPAATQILADLGARVIKVEKPSGDDARGWGPPFWGGAAAVFQSMNRNKESVCVNFRESGDVLALERLIIAEADVVIQSMRPGLLVAHGVSSKRLREAKPSLVWCDLGAYGSGGPLALHAGYDPLMQAFAGLMSVTGEDCGAPVRTGFSVVDVGTGMWATTAILAALLRRSVTGVGCTLEVSLLETALAWMSSSAAHYQSSGQLQKRHGSGTATIVPYRAYMSQDGHIVIAAGSDSLFRSLCKVLGHEEWSADDRFRGNADRVANRNTLDALIEPIIASRPTDAWKALLADCGVPCAPVQSIAQALAHPHTKALGIVQEIPGTDMSMIATPIRFDGERPRFRKRPPALNSDAHILDAHRTSTPDQRKE